MASQKHIILIMLYFFFSFYTHVITSLKIPAIIVFGDSTVDPGNNNNIATLIHSNFPPYGRDFVDGTPTGRFCNGRLSIDFIAEWLGLGPIVPAYLDPNYGIEDFATAVSFASSGTGLDNATSQLVSVIPLWKEVEYFKDYQKRLRHYLGQEAADQRVRDAFYVVSIGTNDFVENYFLLITGRFKQFTVPQFEDFLMSIAADFITTIYQLGARRVSFAGLPPLGCMPFERTINSAHDRACIEEINSAARGFNVKLQATVDALCARLPGLMMTYSEMYDPVLRIITNPSIYGFENVADGCCGTGKVELSYLCNEWNPFTCSDADKYIFWDAIHLSQKMHRIIAQLTLNTTIPGLL